VQPFACFLLAKYSQKAVPIKNEKCQNQVLLEVFNSQKNLTQNFVKKTHQ
jgi:hypothetical protein